MRGRTKWLVNILAVTSLFLLVACGPTPNKKSESLDWPIEDFTYINQDEEEFGLSDLKGQVWIADFIFTNCTTVCLPMSTNMSKLQKRLKEEGLDVQLVSFSVDPEVDDPQTLKKYGEEYEADMKSWTFLTGYDQEEIERFAKENFKTIVQKPSDSDQVTHGTLFYLVDASGKIVKYYDGVKPDLDEIVSDVKDLQNE